MNTTQAEVSAMQYQSLKNNNINNNKQSVFVIDSKGTEQQQINIESFGLPIIHENEAKILKDLEIDSVLYTNNDNEDDDNDIDMESNEDLTIKIKRETNIFNQELVHFEITHPERKSAEERASILLDRAFQNSPLLSPQLTRLSKDFMNMNRRNSSLQLGFGRDFMRSSSNLFPPLSDEFRISDQFRLSQGLNVAPTFNVEMESNVAVPGPIPPPPYYLEVVSDDLHSSITNLKEKVQKHRACARCHKVKKKCIKPNPNGPCVACKKKGVRCESRQDGRKRNKGKKKKT